MTYRSALMHSHFQVAIKYKKVYILFENVVYMKSQYFRNELEN